jgi:major membrane immunogen (membrane-anchored lipoprotein)
MITVKELAKAVTGLSPEQLAEYRAWFKSFDAARWDRRIEEDVTSGKLGRIVEKAMEDYRKGKEKSL